MGFLEAKCPVCAKAIQVPEDAKKVYCAYCGSRFLGEAALAYAGALEKVSVRGASFEEDEFTIVGGTLVDYHGELGDVIIPDGVTCIDQNAFKGKRRIVRVEMPNTVTSIEKRAFQECTSLSEVVFSENLVRINEFAFYGCSSLKMIDLPSTVKEIGDRSFGNCSSLSVANIPSTARYMTNCEFSKGTFRDSPVKIVMV